jgi:hypothetical protein
MNAKNRSAAASDAKGESITLRPPFDPEEFARQSECTTVPPPAGLPQCDPGNTSGTIETIGSLDAVASLDADMVPALLVAREDLDWFDVSPLARQLLRDVDGSLSLGEICARSGQPLDDAIRAFEQLVRDGLVVWHLVCHLSDPP